MDFASERELAKDIVDLMDCQTSVYEQALINAIQNSYLNGADYSFTQNASIVDGDQAALSGISFDNEAMEAARKDLINRLATLSIDMSAMNDAIITAQASDGWTDVASQKAEAAQKDADAIQGDGSIEKLIRDPAFQTLLPSYYLQCMALKPDTSGVTLGVTTMINAPLFLIYVDPNGLAAKLKFRELERIEEFDGTSPRDMADLKRLIKQAAGRTVTVKVAPKFGDIYEYDVEVPEKLK